MIMLKNGFYTALGTPLAQDGTIIKPALKKHIEQQIDAGASGLLLMGSMGIQATIRHSEYKNAVDTAIEAVNGRVPLFVGAMDNSVARVAERLEMIGTGRAIDGIVLTVPYYSKVTDAQAVNFFTAAADISPYPVYLYDLPSVTQFKITMSVIENVIKHGNIKGMKTPDWELIKAIERRFPDAEFECLYSGLDSFDYACSLGIRKNLDGMFACTPINGKAMYEAVDRGDYISARRCLDNILLLRDTMIKYGLMRCFTICMNRIGIDGGFHQDYTSEVGEDAKQAMIETMKQIGEL